jgi:hypothetical protein
MYIRVGVAVALVALGAYKLIRSRHFRWGGMQVGFRDVTIWSKKGGTTHGTPLRFDHRACSCAFRFGDEPKYCADERGKRTAPKDLKPATPIKDTCLFEQL